jgi:hypothetical protein
MAGSEGRRGSAAGSEPGRGGGLIPFVTGFSEAVIVVASGRRVDLRACERCGAIVATDGLGDGVDHGQRHADWHSKLGI